MAADFRVAPVPPGPPAPHRVASVDATERGDVPRFSGDIKAKISDDIKGGWDVADVKKSTKKKFEMAPFDVAVINKDDGASVKVSAAASDF